MEQDARAKLVTRVNDSTTGKKSSAIFIEWSDHGKQKYTLH